MKKLAFTMASAGHAFTMAEILLSLTIIGVVAAITLPSLTGNINERTWNTQRKALYARMSQAISLMSALNGYGKLTAETSEGANDGVDTVAQTFITDGLAKVLKINNICDSGHLSDCGLPEKITTNSQDRIDIPTNWEELNTSMINGSYVSSAEGADIHFSMLNSNAAAFETQNGESIEVFYNPNCQADMGEVQVYMVQAKICVNFIYDLNGSKGPNTVGKDIGVITALYATDPVVVAPMPLVGSAKTGLTYDAHLKRCRRLDEARLPVKNELISIFANKKLLNSGESDVFISGTPNSATTVYAMSKGGLMGQVSKSYTEPTGICVKRN